MTFPVNEWLSIDRLSVSDVRIEVRDGYYVAVSVERMGRSRLLGWIPLFFDKNTLGQRVVIYSSAGKGYLRILERQYANLDEDNLGHGSCENYSLPDSFYLCRRQNQYEIAVSETLYIESEYISIRSAIRVFEK